MYKKILHHISYISLKGNYCTNPSLRNFGDFLLKVEIGPILTEIYFKISSAITGPV
jgi:dsRNA-specific ribonuclease